MFAKISELNANPASVPKLCDGKVVLCNSNPINSEPFILFYEVSECADLPVCDVKFGNGGEKRVDNSKERKCS